MHPTPSTTPVPLGPDSLVWQHFGDWAGLNIALWAGSMQNMHPQLGAGVEEHSRFFEERWERLLRSTYVIGGVVFDGPQAEQTARTIRGYHARIKGIDKHGRPYSALNPDTFFWAHSTFVMSIVLQCEYFGTPLTKSEKDQIWQEGIQWYRLYGLSMRPVPPTWDAFCEYYDDMCRHGLEDNQATRDVLDMSGISPPPGLTGLPDPVWRMLRYPLSRLMVWVTVGMYHEAVRQRLGYRWTRWDALGFRLFTRSFASLWPLLPDRIRTHPRKLRAQQRESGALPGDAAVAQTPDRFLPPREWWSSGMHYLGRHESQGRGSSNGEHGYAGSPERVTPA